MSECRVNENSNRQFNGIGGMGSRLCRAWADENMDWTNWSWNSKIKKERTGINVTGYRIKGRGILQVIKQVLNR